MAVISMKTARARSLKRWRKILADWPHIKTYRMHRHPDEDIYGENGFCQRITFLTECQDCPIYTLCYRPSPKELPVYELITNRLRIGRQDEKLKSLIEQMIKAIKGVR